MPPDLPPSPAERISSYVARFAQRIDAHTRAVAESLGITAGQVQALRELSQPLTLSELACRMACERPNATYVADRMEKQGLVERHAHPHDRRSKILVLTPAGEACRRNVVDALAGKSPLASLSTEDQAALADTLAQLLGVDTSHPDSHAAALASE